MNSNSTQFYEGCGREGPIKCIFLSEFHPVAGSKITCQVKINLYIDLCPHLLMFFPFVCSMCRLPRDMFVRKYLMQLMFTSFQNPSCQDVY